MANASKVASSRYPHNAAAMQRMDNSTPTPTQEENDEARMRTTVSPKPVRPARRASAKTSRRAKRAKK